MLSEIEIEELLISLKEYLERVQNGVILIADMLREGELEQAFNDISDFAIGVEWIFGAIKILEQNDISLNFNKKDMNSKLIEINEGLGVQDFVVVADIFEYEISGIASKWSNSIIM